jgi:mRNA interferase MazF
MTTYSFGDVVLVPFPFTDQSAVKKRPAVLVSSNRYNRQCPDIVIMAVTSQMRWADYYGDVVISDWQQAGLLKPSVIKPVFTTLEKDMVIKPLGQISDSDRDALTSILREILGE